MLLRNGLLLSSVFMQFRKWDRLNVRKRTLINQSQTVNDIYLCIYVKIFHVKILIIPKPTRVR